MMPDRTRVDVEVAAAVSARALRKFEAPHGHAKFILCQTKHHDAYVGPVCV